ncbi:MAG: glycogen synthase GlgA [Oscillospiraceae bacterium]|nr:glycogen synthase GlgA [Oscillospiraceae bacterium]MDD4367461.1 glycogen synthase GlgA [Oscillospiraceae bacterium]
MTPLRVLFVSSEVVPFVKVGGLADVAGSLPQALAARGIDIRVIMPLYRPVKTQYKDKLKFVRWSQVKLGWRSMYSGLLTLHQNGITYYFIDNDYYFGSDQIYQDYSFDVERFCFFQRAVLEACGQPMDFEPDIIHCNDWETGLIPCLLQAHYQSNGYHCQTKTLYTIHNLKFQGVFGSDRIADLCDLSSDYLNDFGVLKDGAANFMKAGIVYSQHVNTVSPTYASEIMNDFYGEGLDAILRGFSYKVSGILNGLDTRSYDPASDPAIPSHYDSSNVVAGKAACKASLQQELGLPSAADKPLFALISRLTEQKGLDLLLFILDELLDDDIQLVVLGNGESRYEDALKAVAARRPDRMAVQIRFDEKLARRIYAGADFFLMPSVFEPCGLSQMIAMRYGALPIVRETGGLKDTVHPYNQYTGTGNGFSFANINAHELLFTSKYAVDVYRRHDEAWTALVKSALSSDFSWDQSAAQYLALYQGLTGVSRTEANPGAPAPDLQVKPELRPANSSAVSKAGAARKTTKTSARRSGKAGHKTKSAGSKAATRRKTTQEAAPSKRKASSGRAQTESNKSDKE